MWHALIPSWLMLSALLLAYGRSSAPWAAEGAPQGKVQLRLEVGGGYVYAFSNDGQSVTLGTLDMPKKSVSPDHYHAHPMFLRLTKGSFDQTQSTHQQSEAENGTKAWNLEGFAVAIRPDGHEQTDHTLAAPAWKKPADPCASPTGADVDNWFYVPDLLRLFPGSKPADPVEQMIARITLDRGTLRVNEIVPGCFSFKDKRGEGTLKARRLTVHGHNGVVYSTEEAAQYVDLVLNPLSGGNPKRIRLLPQDGVVELVLRTERDENAAPKVPMKFFHAYHSLIVNSLGKPIAVDRHLIPIWEGTTQQLGVTPGGECPPVSIGSPRQLADAPVKRPAGVPR